MKFGRCPMKAHLNRLLAAALALTLAAPTAAAAAEIEGKLPGAEGAAKAPARQWGYLGVRTAPVSEELARYLGLDDGRGLAIESVEPGSPAAKAGLEARDIVVRVDDQIIFSAEQFSKLIASKKPGTEVVIARLRRGQELQLKAVLGSTETPSWRAPGAGGYEFWKSWPRGPEGGTQPPAPSFRWRDPGSGNWRFLDPEGRNWQDLEKYLERWRKEIPEEARGNIERQLERMRQRREAGPAGEASQARSSGPELSTSTTITAEQGGYRVTWEKKAGEGARVTLRDKSGKELLKALPEEEVQARAKDLPADAQKLLDLVRKTAAGVNPVQITIGDRAQ
jgi:uncharacterized membrane protein